MIWKASCSTVGLCYPLGQLCGSKGGPESSEGLFRNMSAGWCWLSAEITAGNLGFRHLFEAYPHYLGFLTEWWLDWKGEREGRGGQGLYYREGGRHGEGRGDSQPELEWQGKNLHRCPWYPPRVPKSADAQVLYIQCVCSIFILYILSHL